ncbi:hypothetical protein DPMN_065075 [Dreissena polymorpha]|uniref:Uncharacterized protein n=1 Tax=Dreissena polymorpha TaxID=45954 RepID=A0A9D4CDF1_DREPO|nr:hypothetical protein DPMN_065075 [Dreissena polymorpha]
MHRYVTYPGEMVTRGLKDKVSSLERCIFFSYPPLSNSSMGDGRRAQKYQDQYLKLGISCVYLTYPNSSCEDVQVETRESRCIHYRCGTENGLYMSRLS